VPVFGGIRAKITARQRFGQLHGLPEREAHASGCHIEDYALATGSPPQDM